MARRDYSLTQYFQRVAEARTPKLTFRGASYADWQEWRTQFEPKVRELCGEWPQPVPLEAEVVYRVEEEDFFREKVVYDTEQHWSVPAYVLIPKDRRRARDGRLPAILCLHGHGPYGKDAVAGVVDPNRPELAAHIASLNYDYGAQMAREGYLTISPDSRNFGECADLPDRSGEVNCNWHFLRGSTMGINLLTLVIWDMMRTVDYLETRADVDPTRIGAMGLSWGGTRTTYLGALEPRIKAADIICYLTTYKQFAIDMVGNLCGIQHLPQMYSYGDVADIAGLIAPRPLLVESGIYDDCFPIEATLQAQEHLRRIYRAAGAEDRLHIDTFSGAHQFHGPSAREFFDRYL